MQKLFRLADIIKTTAVTMKTKTIRNIAAAAVNAHIGVQCRFRSTWADSTPLFPHIAGGYALTVVITLHTNVSAPMTAALTAHTASFRDIIPRRRGEQVPRFALLLHRQHTAKREDHAY